MTLLRLIPDAALRALLMFGGLELALAARVQRYAADGGELIMVLLIAMVAVASNAAIAFGIGMAAVFGRRRGCIRW
jgi:MFS superfamily sulfate permease-like transporter